MTEASIGIIVGSAFQLDMLRGLRVEPEPVSTPFGEWILYNVELRDRNAYISFRHGFPHYFLPNHIPYRAQAWAFQSVNCQALLVTSSVGVLDATLPLFEPLLIGDLLTLDNRLPDGSACTMFTEPSDDHAHLVIKEGLISEALKQQLVRIISRDQSKPSQDVVFGYVGGPRTKTKAENRLWKHLGAQVNSMTLAPEIILANELEIPCCAAVVGHKYSVPDIEEPKDEHSVSESFEKSRDALGRIVRGFISEIRTVPFNNHLYRYQ